MLTRKKKIVAASIAIVALAILFSPLILITSMDLYGALTNRPFAHCEVMGQSRLESALQNGFTVSAARGADLDAREPNGKTVREYLRSFHDYDTRPRIRALIEGR